MKLPNTKKNVSIGKPPNTFPGAFLLIYFLDIAREKLDRMGY
jgi:hypothetical protein